MRRDGFPTLDRLAFRKSVKRPFRKGILLLPSGKWFLSYNNKHFHTAIQSEFQSLLLLAISHFALTVLFAIFLPRESAYFDDEEKT